LPRCQYQYKSRTVGSSGNPTTWPQCTELTDGKFCIFQDKEDLESNKQEVTKRFEKKVLDNLSNKEPLDCVGYYIPDIDFANLLGEKMFSQPVYFRGATFHRGVNFSGFTFSGEADFSGAIFSKEVRFSRAFFSEQVNFLDATFSDEANFHGATFSKEVDFTIARFYGKTFFYDNIFYKKASFFNATFSGEADFSVSEFLDTAKFEGNRFRVETDFTKVLFEQPNKVTFDDSDLSKISFANSDITRIRFGDKITWAGEDKFTIIEEQWLEQKTYRKNKVKSRTENVEKQIRKQGEEKPTKENPLIAEILSFDKEKQKFAPATFEFVAIAKGGSAPYQYDWMVDEMGKEVPKKSFRIPLRMLASMP
jgi:uncharacterized protein YjbI with pentapeptide repeats